MTDKETQDFRAVHADGRHERLAAKVNELFQADGLDYGEIVATVSDAFGEMIVLHAPVNADPNQVMDTVNINMGRGINRAVDHALGQ